MQFFEFETEINADNLGEKANSFHINFDGRNFIQHYIFRIMINYAKESYFVIKM